MQPSDDEDVRRVARIAVERMRDEVVQERRLALDIQRNEQLRKENEALARTINETLGRLGEPYLNRALEQMAEGYSKAVVDIAFRAVREAKHGMTGHSRWDPFSAVLSTRITIPQLDVNFAITRPDFAPVR